MIDQVLHDGRVDTDMVLARAFWVVEGARVHDRIWVLNRALETLAQQVLGDGPVSASFRPIRHCCRSP